LPEITAQAAADLVGGRLLGDGAVVLRRASSLDRAGGDAVSLVVSSRYLPLLRDSEAGAVLVPESLADENGGPGTRIVVAEPYRALVQLLAVLHPAPAATEGVAPTAVIGDAVVLGEGVSVGPHSVVGRCVRLGARVRVGAGVVLGDGVQVGDDAVIDANVVCYAGTVLGARVVVKAGAIVGGDGFGYIHGPHGHTRIPHIGGCVLEDDVEIGSNCTIDRGSLDDTVIGQGTKLDNQVHVGHNVRIGRRCLVMGGVGIGGSTRIGNGVVVAGHSTLVDHVTVGDRARIGARSFVIGDVPGGADVSGQPARPHRETLRAQAALRRLEPLIRDLERLVNEGEDGRG
jgi:UDP-3-O-[3-hydroxymyristoyl] glucosamine N-acyltransferase